MLKVGLTGGIGTGKSSVSSLFNDWGAYIFDSDSVAKEILNHDNTAQGEIIAEFGTDILNKEGSIEKNKRADLVLWDPAFFGVKIDLSIIGGSIAASQMGDPNASISTPQPVYTRPMFSSFGKSLEKSTVTFVSKVSLDKDSFKNSGVNKSLLPVKNIRKISKKDMMLNDYCPKIEVNPETYEVLADGELITCEPAETLPLAQRYFMY